MKEIINRRIGAIILLISIFVFNLAAQETEKIINIKSDWKGSIFGNVGGDDKISEENFTISEGDNGLFKLASYNNRGKIASSSEGLAFLYKEISKSDNFELSALIKVNSFYLNNQVSFGLMIRDKVYKNLSVKDDLGSYIALGPIDSTREPYQYGFSRSGKDFIKYGYVLNSPKPMPSLEYELTLKKSGNSYYLKYGSEKPIVIENFNNFEGEELFLGFFTARNTEVEISNINLKKITNDSDKLLLTLKKFKTEYLVNQDFDSSGLMVEVVTKSGKKTELTGKDFFIGGFDSSVSGEKRLNVHYNGLSKSIPITVKDLSITSLELTFPPLKTTYTLLDKFDPTGIQITGIYNNGYKTKILNSDEYSLKIGNKDASNTLFSTPGKHRVTVQSNVNPSGRGFFDITVDDAKLTGLEITRAPTELKYYTGDKFETRGLIVSAVYDNYKKIRLKPEEYKVAELDSNSSGVKKVTVSHKSVSTDIITFVYAIKSRNMVVSKYPRTTYNLGDKFDITGMEISKLYNNGKLELVSPKDYSVDSSSFDKNITGKFNVIITPKDEKFSPIKLPVSIIDKKNYEWKSIRFGQSVSEANNNTIINDDGSLTLIALEGGGKITKDHDGITFYYTTIDPKTQNFTLEGDFTVKAYAKTPHDGQESFGILARDSIGTNNDSSINASNLVAVGGYSGGTKNINGTQLIKREGVTSIDGAGSHGTKMIMLNETKPDLKNSYPKKDYHLKLQKSNSGFHGFLNDKEALFSVGDYFNAQDKKLYIGFYAARLATFDVNNMEFYVSESVTDAPPIPAPLIPKEPIFEILSPNKTSNADYNLIIKTNFAGSLTIKKGFDIVQSDIPLDSGQLYEFNTDLNLSSFTDFSIVFIPDDTQELTDYSTIIRYLKVEQKRFTKNKDIYVSEKGDMFGEGTKDSPVDIDTAISFVMPGQKIIIAGGTYNRKTPVMFDKYNDGLPNAYKTFEAAPGERAIIDFQRFGEFSSMLSGNYWKIKGIDFIHTAGNVKGLVVGGNYNIVEDCKFYENGDTGLSINRTDVSENRIEYWPSNNLILNCESFDNIDPSQNNADGFAAKITTGYNNIFRNCIARNNIDDGWDLYTKAGTGVIGSVLVEECVAYGNGTLSNGSTGKGDKNGFKLGGEGILVPHILKDSLSFKNGANGITNNSNPGIIIENSFSVNNEGSNVNLATYTNVKPQFKINGLYLYPDDTSMKDITDRLSKIPFLKQFITNIK